MIKKLSHNIITLAAGCWLLAAGCWGPGVAWADGELVASKEYIGTFTELSTNSIEEILSLLDMVPANQDAGAKVFVSGFSISGSDEDFLLLHTESNLYCGTHGCMNAIFKAENGKYRKLPISIVANRPVYKRVCGNKTSLIFSPGGGSDSPFSEWIYKDGNFEFYKKYASLEKISACE